MQGKDGAGKGQCRERTVQGKDGVGKGRCRERTVQGSGEEKGTQAAVSPAAYP